MKKTLIVGTLAVMSLSAFAAGTTTTTTTAPDSSVTTTTTTNPDSSVSGPTTAPAVDSLQMPQTGIMNQQKMEDPGMDFSEDDVSDEYKPKIDDAGEDVE